MALYHCGGLLDFLPRRQLDESCEEGKRKLGMSFGESKNPPYAFSMELWIQKSKREEEDADPSVQVFNGGSK